MRLWPFGRNRATATPAAQPQLTVVPFPDDIGELPVLKHHALRALCGWFMDRHSACRGGHPWCNVMPGEVGRKVIAHAIPQRNEADGDLLLSIYVTRAKGPEPVNPSEQVDPLQYTAELTYADPVPSRKLVVQPVSDGTYFGRYGAILSPTEGDYSTGLLDVEAGVETFYCDPDPAHGKVQYWDMGLSAEQNVVPEFHCLELRGEWWVVDYDRERRMAQQAAAVAVRDNPNHAIWTPG